MNVISEMGKNGIMMLKKYSPITYEAVRQEAKKEVIDDVKSALPKVYYDAYKIYELEKRHLSTFAEQKRHNNDFDKVCPDCGSSDGHYWMQEWKCHNCHQYTVIKEGKPIPKS